MMIFSEQNRHCRRREGQTSGDYVHVLCIVIVKRYSIISSNTALLITAQDRRVSLFIVVSK